ncbi:MAG: ribonuclease H-like domain-containing protein [Chloroflexi bacterium]|nr:ribonuclease H-like domain-containing protein [Chloroflexota bacterium]MCL5075228.1 ribonuclease H-like domain-containing protein [Chloroflexota bacterium]
MLEAYLDIETTGLSPIRDSITVIGLCLADDSHYKLIQLVGEGITKHNLLQALQGVQVIYTYNGTQFDLSFITVSLGIDLDKLCKHHDLMLDCWKNDFYGGFKATEAALGIKRQLKGINGAEAVRLWRKYKVDQDQESLAVLLQYNKEDVLNLKLLKDKLYAARQHCEPSPP